MLCCEACAQSSQPLIVVYSGKHVLYNGNPYTWMHILQTSECHHITTSYLDAPPFLIGLRRDSKARSHVFPKHLNIPLSRKGPFQKWGNALGFTGIGDVNGIPMVALRQH